jgi:hypothetical protein
VPCLCAMIGRRRSCVDRSFRPAPDLPTGNCISSDIRVKLPEMAPDRATASLPQDAIGRHLGHLLLCAKVSQMDGAADGQLQLGNAACGAMGWDLRWGKSVRMTTIAAARSRRSNRARTRRDGGLGRPRAAASGPGCRATRIPPRDAVSIWGHALASPGDTH